MTFTRLIRSYIFDPISLAMTRLAVKSGYGNTRFFLITTVIPVMLTFICLGLWHGDSWNFILFGMLHGIYLATHTLWVKIKQKYPIISIVKNPLLSNFIARSLTFLSVTASFALFRTETFYGAKNIISGMLGLNGFEISPNLSGKIGSLESWLLEHGGIYQDLLSGASRAANMNVSEVLLFIILLASIAFFLPNTQQIMNHYKPAYESYKDEISYKGFKWMEWKPNTLWALFISALFTISVLSMGRIVPFVYNQF